jgi:hypothetical protein
MTRRSPALELPHPYASHTIRGKFGQRYQVRIVGQNPMIPSLVEVENCWTGERATVLRSSLVEIRLEEDVDSDRCPARDAEARRA